MLLSCSTSISYSVVQCTQCSSMTRVATWISHALCSMCSHAVCTLMLWADELAELNELLSAYCTTLHILHYTVFSRAMGRGTSTLFNASRVDIADPLDSRKLCPRGSPRAAADGKYTSQRLNRNSVIAVWNLHSGLFLLLKRYSMKKPLLSYSVCTVVQCIAVVQCILVQYASAQTAQQLSSQCIVY